MRLTDIRKHLRSGLLEIVRWVTGPRRHLISEIPLCASQSKRLLFFQYETALGIAINATPVFEAVKKAMQDSVITVASAGLPYDVLKFNPFIDRIVRTPNPHQALSSAAIFILRSLRNKEKFDCAITDTGNQKARIALLGVLAGAKRRIGFTAAPELYHTALQRDLSLSVLQDNLRLMSALELECQKTAPRVFFSQHEAAMVERLLTQKRVAATQPLVVLATQTSGGDPTNWYDDRFAAVADYMADRHGVSLVFVGTRKDVAAIDGIRRLMHANSTNLAGETDIPTLCALLCRSDLVLTLDTGTMHVARAATVPMVVIAPSAQPAYEWLPLGLPNCTILRRNDIWCTGCRKHICATRECMEEIGTTEVIAAVDALWVKYPPSPLQRELRIEKSQITV